MKAVLQMWDERPLLLCLILGLAIRLVAVFFAPGYGYHDDHFLTIEPAQSWLDGRDKGNMITDTPEENTSGRSLLYPAINYLILGACESVGISDPFAKMTVNRLIHALYSLLVIVFGFRLTLELSDLKKARVVGLLLALFWMFPQLSVRNLVEVVPIPLMLYGSLLLVQHLKGKRSVSAMIILGILMAVCFTLRYQTILFAGGLGIGLLLLRQWKSAIIYGVTALFSIGLIHGIGDYFLCGGYFCKLQYYIDFNVNHSGDYTTEPWHFYLGILAGVLVPPLSLFLFFGLFRAYKIDLSLWIATLLFLVFHSIFPNKQERFIFTIIPHLIILGYLGFMQFLALRPPGKLFRGVIRFAWIFFWVLNIPMLFIYSTYDNKTARTEGVAYMAKQEDFKSFVVMDPTDKRAKDAPLYFGDKYPIVPHIGSRVTSDSVKQILSRLPDDEYPNYLVLCVNKSESLTEKEVVAREYFPEITFLHRFEMGMVDAFRNKLNKGIGLDDWAIYRIEGKRTVPYDSDSNPIPNYFK